MIEEEFKIDPAGVRQHLLARWRSRAPEAVQILTGPRQVGKTTLLLALAKTLGDRCLYGAGDDPEASLPGWWDRLWTAAEERAVRGKACLLLDEVQHFPGWSQLLKGRWDRIRRLRIPLHVIVSGSTALRIGTGSRESLAGRFERLVLSHWPAAALAATFKLGRSAAAMEYVLRGSYPGAFPLRRDPARWRAYLRDSIIEPAIGRDLLALGLTRRPQLLRHLFFVCLSLPARIVSVEKLTGQIRDSAALETVSHYLRLLEEGYLVAGLQKYSAAEHRRRASPPKILVLNHALLAAGSSEGSPDPARDRGRFGFWVENACLAHAWNSGQRVSYWREEPLEVDGVIEGSWGCWALEVKSGSWGPSDLTGLLEFCRRNPRFRPLLITDPSGMKGEAPMGVARTTWEDFLLEGPPR